MRTEDPYRHPGGRTYGVFAALILTLLCSGGGLAAGYLWAAIR